jgi:hypothetical protein
MRRTRRRNTSFKRIVLGFAVVMLMAPAAAQARVDVSTGQGTTAHTDGSQTDYVAGVTDFPKSVAVPKGALENDYVAGVTDFPRAVAGVGQVNGPYSFPQALPIDYGLQRGDLIESVRLNPRTTARDYDLIENRRADSPRVSTPVAVASPGFDWGDAGIGAALALGLVVLLAGAAVLASRRHRMPQTA